jgi:hypothetical protein
MGNKRKTTCLVAIIFLISVLLRLALICFNREANDPHEGVAALILGNHSLPSIQDCWECFQPKLFHLVFAGAIQAFGWTKEPAYHQNIAGEVINFVAGVVTLIYVWLLIRQLTVKKETIKVIAFGLVALNPALIGINSQATNDTFAILFSTLAIFFTAEFFKQQRGYEFFLFVLFALLGISSKTNCWVTAIAITLALAIWAWVKRKPAHKGGTLWLVFLFLTVSLSIFNPLNQYVQNYKQYGSPVLLNITPKPIPHFFGTPPDQAQGIWYIQDGFFTFKIAELIEHPRTEIAPQVRPTQTSFWTLIFGRANSVLFDNSVPSWVTTGTNWFLVDRGLFLLALLPTLFLLIGAIICAYGTAKSLVKRDASLASSTSYGLFVLIFLGYVGFEFLYALFYRSFTVIKAIFIYPALLSFPLLFICATDRLFAILSQWKNWLISIFETAIGALFLFYILDVSALILHLVDIYISKHKA